MKKLIALAMLSIALIGASASQAQAFFLKHLFCCKKCYVLKIRQVNAFTPFCTGETVCTGMPCCPPFGGHPGFGGHQQFGVHCGLPADTTCSTGAIPTFEPIAAIPSNPAGTANVQAPAEPIPAPVPLPMPHAAFPRYVNPYLQPAGYNPYAAWGQQLPYYPQPMMPMTAQPHWNGGR